MKQKKSISRTSILLPVFILVLFLNGIVAFADLTVLPTDVSTPSEGCIFLGLQGRYFCNASAFLARINEIRLEACQEGVWDPSDPNKTRTLTAEDYVPLKWSGELEYCARIRAAEAMVTMGHVRTNGSNLTMTGPDNQIYNFDGKEGLAWIPQQGGIIEGINLWYGEKEAWVNQVPDATTGPYEAMINPENRYVGVGLFNGNYGSSGDTPSRNCTAAVYSTIETGLSETPLSLTGDCFQTLEVAKSHCNGGQISGIQNNMHQGDTCSLTLKANVRYSSNNSTYNSKLMIPDTASVAWRSDTLGIVSVDSDGVATANYCGSAYIYASYENISVRTQFQVRHKNEPVPEVPATCTESGRTAGERCSVCGRINFGLQTIDPIGHDWNNSVYSWSEDNTTATATRTCNRNSEHVETETVNAVSEITLQPTCETGGETTYTAVFTNDAFTTQTKTLQNIAAAGHEWKLESWSWEDDFSKATALFICQKDSSHELPQQASITIGTTPETCETAGSKRYTATAAVEEKTYTDTRTESIPATGHDWNGWTVTREATYDAEGEEQRTCKNDSSHIETRSIAKLVKPADTSTTTPGGASSGTSSNTPSTTPSSTTPTNTAASTNTTPPTTTPPKTSPAAASTNPSTTTPLATLSGQAGSAGTGTEGIAFTPETEVNEAEAPTDKAQEKTILALKSDNDPKGSTYGLLQAQMKKVTNNSITLKWKKIKGAKYVIYGNKCGKKNKYKKLKTVKGTSFTQKKLKKGTYYKYLVVAVKNGKAIATSKTIHVATKGGKVGNTKTVKAKNLSIKVGGTARINVTTKAAGKKLKVKSHRAIAYESSNTNIATVLKKGVVKGIRSGSCYVYAYAQDGVMAKIKVTVG